MKEARKTLQQKLAARQIKLPPAAVYIVLGYLWRLLYLRRLNIHFDYRIDLRDNRKGPYFKGEYYEFIPETETTAKWLLATEEIHRINGGRWKNFLDAKTYDKENRHD